jgi:hypothetical protein
VFCQDFGDLSMNCELAGRKTLVTGYDK